MTKLDVLAIGSWLLVTLGMATYWVPTIVSTVTERDVKFLFFLAFSIVIIGGSFVISGLFTWEVIKWVWRSL